MYKCLYPRNNTSTLLLGPILFRNKSSFTSTFTSISTWLLFDCGKRSGEGRLCSKNPPVLSNVKFFDKFKSEYFFLILSHSTLNGSIFKGQHFLRQSYFIIAAKSLAYRVFSDRSVDTGVYSFAIMIRFILTIVVLSQLTTSAIWIGKLSQYIYRPSPFNPVILHPYSDDCHECLCYAKSLNNISIVVLNCLNDSSTCWLFTNYSETYSFQPSSAGQIYFFQMPPSRPTTVAASRITSPATTDGTSATTRTSEYSFCS